MTRTLPIVLISTLAVGGGFTLAVNFLLGGTVEEAPARITNASRSVSAYPPEAGNPRLWRTESRTGSRKRREAGNSRRRTRKPRSAAPASPAQSTTGAPAPGNPLSETASPASSSAPARPAPAKPKPSKPQPSRSGGNFYSTG
jgi:hypothetical protein